MPRPGGAPGDRWLSMARDSDGHPLAACNAAAGQAEARALTGAATAAASSSRRSSQATGELLPTRPLCQLKTFGLWKEQVRLVAGCARGRRVAAILKLGKCPRGRHR